MTIPPHTLRSSGTTLTTTDQDGQTVVINTDASIVGSPLVSQSLVAAGTPGGFVMPSVINEWMADLINRCPYAGLLMGDPAASEDAGSTEVSTATYARASVEWMLAGSGLITVVNQLTWNGLLAGSRIGAIGFFDSPAGGNLSAAVYLADVQGLLSTTSFALAAGKVFLSIDAIG